MFAATASTDKRTAQDTVHNNSLFCSVAQCSAINFNITVQSNIQCTNDFITFKAISKQVQNSWGSYTATGSEITEKVKLLCNTHNDVIY